LDQILQSWELKSIWEIWNWDNNIQYKTKRDFVENNLWYATDVAEKGMEHILYWGMVTDESLKRIDRLWAAPGYTKNENIVFIKLKKEKIQKDVLFVIDDSFSDFFSRNWNPDNWLHYSQVDLEWAAYWKVLQNFNWKRSLDYPIWISYVEANVFNGMKVSDIEWIFFDKKQDYLSFKERYPQYNNLLFLVE
jgi:hypothetical protein